MSTGPKSNLSPLPAGEDLLRFVREAAEFFAAQMSQAERVTRGWQDEPKADELVCDAANGLLARLADSGCWGEANRLPSGELWRVASGWLDHGSLLRQARFKPRGYAGDFDLLGKICDGWRCEHPLGRILDGFFQSQAAPQAVRHRTQIVAEAIVTQCRQFPGEACRVVSVGSGPARDIERALLQLSIAERRCVHVTLLDLDPMALESAAARLAPLWPEGLAASQLVCARENLFRLARNARAAAYLQGADILSCVGFFDYLADSDAAPLLAAFWQALAPMGRLLVFNFTPANPSRAFMEWIGNWYLRYRALDELADLAGQAQIPVDCRRVDAEELGVDAFLEMVKQE